MRRGPGPGSGARGQALTEFIIVIPLFFILLLGVVQLALLSFAQQMVHYAAFAATRAAIVRPCMAFHPDNDNVSFFTPTVFSAAALANMAAAPGHNILASLPYAWLPDLPDSQEIIDLDIGDGGVPVGGAGEVAEYKYINAAYLTSVVRVTPDYGTDPVEWEINQSGAGIGPPCVFWWDPTIERRPRHNVPPPTLDLSLEVIFLYPMRIPLVNRIFYGIFVNFSSMAQDTLNLSYVRNAGEGIENVMKLPTNDLPSLSRYRSSINSMVNSVMSEYDFSSESRSANIHNILIDRRWYPLPLRARCTLTVEGSLDPLVTFPSW